MAKTGYSPKPQELHAANLSELKNRLKSGKVSGTYVFYGDEEYTKNRYYDSLAEFCDNRALNVKTIAGAEFRLEDFINSCDTVPAQSTDMFAFDDGDGEEKTAYRLVRLIAPKLDVMNQKETNEFLSRIEDPDEGVIIVLWLYSGEQDKLSKGIYKKIADAALTINFRHETPGSPVLVAWVLKHFNRAEVEIERNVAMYMCNYVGNDMTDLKNEIDNCISFVKYEGRNRVTAEDIEFICKKSVSAQVFDITAETLSGNYEKAMTALNAFVKTSRSKDKAAMSVFAPMTKAIYDLCKVAVYSKSGEGSVIISKKTGLHEFVVKKNLALIRERARSYNGKGTYAEYAAAIGIEYDTKSKRSSVSSYELLREMIYKLVYPAQQ